MWNRRWNSLTNNSYIPLRILIPGDGNESNDSFRHYLLISGGLQDDGARPLPLYYPSITFFPHSRWVRTGVFINHNNEVWLGSGQVKCLVFSSWHVSDKLITVRYCKFWRFCRALGKVTCFVSLSFDTVVLYWFSIAKTRIVI